MKLTVILLLASLLITGCGREKEPETIVLNHAAENTAADLPDEFYPRALSGDSVLGTGGDGVLWFDGESHTAGIVGSLVFCPVDGGAAGVVTSHTDGETVTSVRFLTSDGDVSVPVRFGSFTTDEIGAAVPELMGLYPTSDGAVLITGNEIIALTPEGEKSRQSVRQVISVNYCPDGVCVLAYDDVADRHVYLLNDDGGLDEVNLTLPEKAMTDFFLMDGEGYYADDEGIFTLAGDPVLSFSQSGWLKNGIDDLRMDGEEVFTVLGTHAGSGTYGVYQMKKSAGRVERILVEAVYDANAGRNIPEAAAMFNASSDTYFVRCTEMEESEGSLGAMERILLTDELPDLAVLDAGTPLDDYINKEVFCDLSAYLDPGAFMDCARAGLESDGKLYTVSAGFTVRTCSGRDEFLPDSWTYTDLLALHDSLGENQRMFRSGGYYEDLLYGAGSLIDGDTIDTAALAKLYGLMAEEPRGISGRMTDTEPYITGQILLKSTGVNSVDTYVQMKAYAGWEEPQIVGYPSAEGSVHRIEFDNRIAVLNDGDSPDGGAAFAEYLIHTYPITESGRDFCSIPVSDACWDGWIGLLQQSGMTFAFEPGSGEWWPGYVQSEPGTVIVELDDALCGEFRDWLNGLTPAERIPDQVYAILTEELSAVKGGSVSPEEGAERAAGRIRLYMGEKS